MALGKTAPNPQIENNAIGLKYDTDYIYQPKLELYLLLPQLPLQYVHKSKYFPLLILLFLMPFPSPAIFYA